MKTPILLATLLTCALPALAQPDNDKPANGLPFRLVSPEAAEALAIVKPIKLNLDKVTLRAALEELQKQSGVELDLERNAPDETLQKTLSVHFETRSFNRAFLEIMDEAGVKASLQRTDTNRPWSIAWDQVEPGAQALQSEVGLFRARLMSLNTVLSKSVNLTSAGKDDKRDQQNNLNVRLALLPDLRLPLIGSPRARLTRAEDDQGRSLLVKTDENEGRFNSYSFYQNNNWEQRQTNLRLRAPEEGAQTLAHLEGRLVYAVVGKTEKWEVPDLLAKAEWTREFKSDGQKFEMSVKPTFKDERLALIIEVTTNRPVSDGQIGSPLLASGPVLEAIRITDANGTPLRRSGYGGGTGNQKMTANATFYLPPRNSNETDETAKKGAPPFKFVFDAPVDVVQTEVPFSFEDVPLP